MTALNAAPCAHDIDDGDHPAEVAHIQAVLAEGGFPSCSALLRPGERGDRTAPLIGRDGRRWTHRPKPIAKAKRGR